MEDLAECFELGPAEKEVIGLAGKREGSVEMDCVVDYTLDCRYNENCVTGSLFLYPRRGNKRTSWVSQTRVLMGFPEFGSVNSTGRGCDVWLSSSRKSILKRIFCHLQWTSEWKIRVTP